MRNLGGTLNYVPQFVPFFLGFLVSVITAWVHMDEFFSLMMNFLQSSQKLIASKYNLAVYGRQGMMVNITTNQKSRPGGRGPWGLIAWGM